MAMLTRQFFSTLVLTLAAAAALPAAPGRCADLVRVGEGPFITGGGFLVAREKGYFKRLGIDIDTKMFIDGALAVPALISGELRHHLHDRQRRTVQLDRQGCTARALSRSRQQQGRPCLYGDERDAGALRPRRAWSGGLCKAQGQEDRAERAGQHQP